MRVPGNSVLPSGCSSASAAIVAFETTNGLFHKSSLPANRFYPNLHSQESSTNFTCRKKARTSVKKDCGIDLCPSWEKHLGHLQVTSLVYDHRKLLFQAVRGVAPLSLTNLALLPFWWNGL